MIAADNKCDETSVTTSKPITSSQRVYHAGPSRSFGSRLSVFAFLGPHLITRCPKSLTKSQHDRRSDVRRLKLCFNCLGTHKHQSCISFRRFNTCSEKHHSLLHFDLRARSQFVHIASEIYPMTDVYGQSLHPGVRYILHSLLVTQKIALEWILSGPMQTSAAEQVEPAFQVPVRALHCASEDDLNQSLSRFRTLEELSDSTRQLSP